MTVPAIMLPVFIQVALTFAILFLLGPRRGRALKAGDVKGDPLLDDGAWPASVRQASNSFRNQFEIPVLFYALTAFAMIAHKADLIFVVLAWVFVLSRIGHAFVHLTSNDIRLRFPLFLVGVVVLLVMWVLFALSILFAPVLP
ncbi:MAPEG family protein [Ancylobacter sp. 6x-1]|uniref:MAPEG family protein n=1 Tax=Ancylobacter crimeensis TaxID=2579147 RepID=A0ABT0D5W2_9HYPH|nr:MAPEG family protein [Ancylobacter crimeensis]MCK0195322.1 MAPEG family protein [Ancylobacter crimeensis]